MFAGTHVPELTSLPPTERASKYGEQKQARVSEIILAFCHRLRRALSFLRNTCGLRRRPGLGQAPTNKSFLSVVIQSVAALTALPQPEYLGYTSAISRIRGGKIVDKITAHVKANISSPQSQSDRTDQRQRQHPWWWRC